MRGLRLGVRGSEFGVRSFGLRVTSQRFTDWGLGFRVSGFHFVVFVHIMIGVGACMCIVIFVHILEIKYLYLDKLSNDSPPRLRVGILDLLIWCKGL